MKQISIQITEITARQISELAEAWGLSAVRHNTAVIERAVAMVHMFEMGTEKWKAVLEAYQAEQKSF